MDEKIFIRPPEIGGITSRPGAQAPSQKEKTTNFAEVLQQELVGQAEIKFSAHALRRLQSRQIEMGADNLQELKEAVNKAEAKGARESLILMDKLALVVSVKNRTVITAVDEQSLKDNVFTNIDSAVIVR